MLLALGWTEIHVHSVLGKYSYNLSWWSFGDSLYQNCSVSLTACSYSRTAFVLSFSPFQEDKELRLEKAIFCEGYYGIAAFLCLEMDAVLLGDCTAIPLLLCPCGCCTGQGYWVTEWPWVKQSQ